jgi:hypothetical protein
VDYQGQRYIQGLETGYVGVPSMANRAGDFGSAAAFTGTVNGPYLAQVLTQRLGYQVTQGEAFSKVFPNGTIPQQGWSPVASKMLQYIPMPNVNGNEFSSGAYKETTTSTTRTPALWAAPRCRAMASPTMRSPTVSISRWSSATSAPLGRIR